MATTKYGFKTTAARSSLMSKIRSTNTKPEIALRKELKKLGYKFSIYSKTIPGNPDFIFRKQKLIVFVDGEFWHGYKWKEKKPKIKANRDYWIKKIEGNIKRDKQTNKTLKSSGWRVLRFWEHQVRKKPQYCIKKISSHLENTISNNK